MMAEYWLSTPKMTIAIRTDDAGRITWAAPVAWRFIGQPLANLESWLSRIGGGGIQKERLCLNR